MNVGDLRATLSYLVKRFISKCEDCVLSAGNAQMRCTLLEGAGVSLKACHAGRIFLAALNMVRRDLRSVSPTIGGEIGICLGAFVDRVNRVSSRWEAERVGEG